MKKEPYSGQEEKEKFSRKIKLPLNMVLSMFLFHGDVISSSEGKLVS